MEPRETVAAWAGEDSDWRAGTILGKSHEANDELTNDEAYFFNLTLSLRLRKENQQIEREE